MKSDAGAINIMSWKDYDRFSAGRMTGNTRSYPANANSSQHVMREVAEGCSEVKRVLSAVKGLNCFSFED